MPSTKSPNSTSGESPKISVVIATYNYGKFISRAVDSVLAQTMKNYEIIVVDDGSTDNTQEILAGYGDRIRIIKQENQGYVKAKNRGLREARGEYVILLDADDEFLPQILEKLSEALEKDTAAVFAYCDYHEMESTGKKKLISLKENLFNSVGIGILFRKSVLEEAGLYDVGLIFPEYDLLLKIQQKGYGGVDVNTPLFVYYRHKGSITTDKEKVEKGRKQLEERYGKKIHIREY